MGLFDKIQKYAGSWTIKNQFDISAEDRVLLMPTATVVKSNFGRSFRFTQKVGGYQQYIPLNEKSAAVIGGVYRVEDIVVQQLYKDGENDIYRCILKSEID